jgi:hypothetical protein
VPAGGGGGPERVDDAAAAAEDLGRELLVRRRCSRGRGPEQVPEVRRGLLPHGHQLQDHGGRGVQRHAWRSKLVAAMRLLVCRCADASARRVARSVVVWPGQVRLCGLRAEPPSADETGVRYRGSELAAISNISKSITNRLAKQNVLGKEMENLQILACNSLAFKLAIVSGSPSPPHR